MAFEGGGVDGDRVLCALAIRAGVPETQSLSAADNDLGCGGRVVEFDSWDLRFDLGRRNPEPPFLRPVQKPGQLRGDGAVPEPQRTRPTPLRLIIDLVAQDEVPRMPDWETVDILGMPIPRLKLHAFEASAALKIKKAMEIVHNPQMIIK